MPEGRNIESQYFPSDEEVKEQEDFFDLSEEEQKKTISQDHDEANRIHKKNSEYESRLKTYMSPTTESAEKYARRFEELEKWEEKEPKIGKAIKGVQRAVNRVYPEYVRGFDIRDYLHFRQYNNKKDRKKDGWKELMGTSGGISGDIEIAIGENPIFEQLTTTLAHEVLHSLSFHSTIEGPDGKGHQRGIEHKITSYRDGKMTVYYTGFNEAITEYLAHRMLKDGKNIQFIKKINWDAREATRCPEEQDFMALLESKIGIDVIESAYFKGKKNLLVDAMGEDAFYLVAGLLDKHKFLKAADVIKGINNH